jgi:DNA-binding NarL/FixJ family response regulator
MKRINVLLAEDHRIVREGIRSLLKHERDIKVVGEAANGREAVQLNRKLRPAVIVMDIGMPVLNGLEATRQICKDFPEVKVLVLSAHDDDTSIEEAVASGAAGFLVKHTSLHVLANAIREVRNGDRFFCDCISERVCDVPKHLLKEGKPRKRANRLSPREVEVLQLIAEGKPNKQVAAELGVTFKTVDKHRQNLMNKLDIHDVAGLTRYAIAERIIEGNVHVTVT